MVRIFLDSADIHEMIRLESKVAGFTTNPTLMRKAGVTDYRAFAKIVADRFPDKPVSLEVIADDFNEMERQARLLASLGKNIYVKIPITNTKGESSATLIERLAKDININVTAVMDFNQWGTLDGILKTTDIVSFFCGRMMDTQYYPFNFSHPKQAGYQKLWASTREVFNVKMAEDMGYDIITMTPELISKLDLKGKDLTQYSLETVQMFYNDAQKAGYVL